MDELLELRIGCPYCGELIDVCVEILDDSQEYIEDCQVCCRPIIFTVSSGMEGQALISVRSENETF